MATNENNERNSGHQSEQPGYQQNPGEQKDHEGEQNAFGQDQEELHSYTADQSGLGAHPDSAGQNREGQQKGGNSAEPLTGEQDGRLNEDDPNGMKDVDKVIPEVPMREEPHEVKTPEADGKTANREGIDRFDANSSDKGTIDDSSKFSE